MMFLALFFLQEGMIRMKKNNQAELEEKDASLLAEDAPGDSVRYGEFPIVGIGASAGGLAAFEAFFSGIPADVDPGMAFVLVQHLAPDHESILTDLVRRYTRMQVFEVEDGMKVRINCAYIIPPGRDMAFLNGTLQLLEPSALRGLRLPIDFFFRSLAQDQRERSIGIVLSGTGSDGTLGVRAIKGEGGMVMAQTPDSTEYDGMPRSAIATGMVDFELPPVKMAAALMGYAAHAFSRTALSGIPTPKTENNLNKIFVLLRAQTGHDFSQYKPNTIMRRIERRMAVHQIDSIDAYVKYLQQTAVEAEALFRDLLIGVTNFFRDVDAFKALEEAIIPKLFEGKSAGAVVRVWIAGCSTGEEAYSIAILIMECMERIKQSFIVQVFATDIDAAAIATARTGIYPSSISADVSAERLSRFFTAEPGGMDGNPQSYRINKSIRDILVFSEQNVIKDPPFSKLDLISCRNLMIYLGGELQKKLIPLFHYALNPDGMLFLGTSETVGEYLDLFAVLDRKAKLYKRKLTSLGMRHMALGGFLPHSVKPDGAGMPPPVGKARYDKIPLRELAEHALFNQLAPSSALVGKDGDIFFLHGRTGMYLEPATGEVGVYNIIKMAREGLRRELTNALHKAVHTNESVRCPNLRVKTNGHFTSVNLTVCPAAAHAESAQSPALYLVILEEGHSLGSDAGSKTVTGADAGQDELIATLKKELQAKEEYLQSANEELETSNEELKSSNEEMQSVNEELQSTNEELETSKEELQSVNEELSTVNNELSTKVSDLSQVNNDMNNLLAGTGIATLFVDHQLRMLRFTPTASLLINLIKSDVGRPINHFVTNLVGYDRMTADIQGVLDTLIPKEVEVQTAKGLWFTMRILPYRTLDNVIEGAVITFVDITERRKIGEALKESEELFIRLFNEAPLGIALIDSLSGRIFEVNPMFAGIAGRTREEMENLTWMSITHPDDIQKDLDQMALLNAGKISGFQMEKRYLHKDGTPVWIRMTIASVKVEDPAHPRHLCMIEDISERKQIE